MSDLERRIAAALTGDVAAAQIDALITETEGAIADADAAAATEREKGLDPVLSPNANAAREAVASAEFARDRLRTVLPRLEARYDRIAAAELRTAWEADYTTLKVERDTLAAEFAEVYPECVRRIIDVLIRCSQMDGKLSRLHLARPAGLSLHLHEPELHARGLERFTRDTPSIARELRLPAFVFDGRLAWPLRQ